MHINMNKMAGFTLIELVIAVIIIGILASIAFPSYQRQIQKSRRTDAIFSLTDLANRIERYYTETNTYATATIATGNATDVLSSANSTEGYYTLSIVGGGTTATTYTILATAVGVQSSDTECGDFTLTDAGVKTVSGTGNADDCW